MRQSFFLRFLLFVIVLTMLAPLGSSAANYRGTEPLISLDLDEAHAQGDDFAKDAFFQARWLQVSTQVIGPQDITLRVLHDDDHTPDHAGRVVFKRVVKNVNGEYVSPEIFLPFMGSGIEAYRVELLYDDDVVRSVPFHRALLNLTNNSICLRGIRFSDVNKAKTDKWYTFRPINLRTVADGTTIDLVGSNMYFVGKLLIHRSGDEVKFEIQTYDQLVASKDIEVEGAETDAHLHSYVVTDHAFDFTVVRIGIYHRFTKIKSVSRSAIPSKIQLDEWYNLRQINANGPVILYLNCQANYNPNGLPRINAVQSPGSLQRILESNGLNR